MIKYQQKDREIKIAMAKKGYTQQKLSEVANLNPSTVSVVLSGKKSVSANTASKICRALEDSIENLFSIQIA